ncbi:hypothetical protein M409DRAFT_55801 [Zasmidium cellare ATCC 36951]|uniref:2EXR domain-containing protein n=1 Tax=Zasmidium cellare ATCC 36951 TaxID=1080233 RepID=A0A6A6CGU0_ZASCE|nr:uncharacterized protein M409DRAFT_55801 [Zasmidium cellare ATCC 36951]KAF2165398.1 hypothetical protein M409DRAFT_55801 [Zasmidium cellare ATCC 36951]
MVISANGEGQPSADNSNVRPSPAHTDNAYNTDNKNLPLFRLPAELRIRIYRMIVVKPNPIHLTDLICVGHTDERHKLAQEAKQPPLAHVCSQLYHEVSHTFYADNVFKFSSIRSAGYAVRLRSEQAERMVTTWLATLSEANQNALGSVRVCVDLCWTPEGRDRKKAGLYKCVDELQVTRYRYSRAPRSEWRDSHAELTGWYWEYNVVPKKGCGRNLGTKDDQFHVRHHLLVKKS